MVPRDSDATYELQLGDVLLPPDALLVLLVPGREQIVGVHDHVDETVERPEKDAVAAGNELGADPRQEGHSEMVVDVQECHLVVFLAEYEEDLMGKKKTGLSSGLRFRVRFLLCPEGRPA